MLNAIYRYGWFWTCPNGENCMYRHALPAGFVLKAQKKAQDDAARENQISIEEFLEVEVRCTSLLFTSDPALQLTPQTSATNWVPI